MGKGRAEGFRKFPKAVRDRINTAVTIAAEGRKADIAKPMKGLGRGVMEIALRYRTNAYRAVYVTEIAGTLWVMHAFQKKSPKGIKTAQTDIDLVRRRLQTAQQDYEARYGNTKNGSDEQR